jgi:hypothetical protein
MESLPEYIDEYKKQLRKGMIQKAYRGLMEYIMDLRTYLKNKYPDYFISGGIYYGYMDMTYFSFFPESFKQRNLKAAIVFNYDRFRFEVWLAGYNKQVQKKYWELFKESGWDKYRLVPSIEGEDAIIECTLADDPDFGDTASLTAQLETGALNFINDIQDFLDGR